MKLNLFFLENAILGKNSLWRFALTILTTVVFYFIGVFITGLVGIYLNNGTPPKEMSSFIVKNSNVFISTIATNLEFIFGIIGLLLAVKLIHKRNPTTLITTYSKINWKTIFFGAIVYFIIYAIVEIVYSFYSGNSFQLVLQTDKFFPLLFISLLIVPLQTSFEELFHRGYLLQTLNYYLGYPIITLFITSVLFASLHFEQPNYLIFYFISGLLLGMIVIVSNSLELALGIHIVHNLFGLFIADNSTDISFFYHKENPENILIWLIPDIIIFILVLYNYGNDNLKLLFVKSTLK
ncbi:CPBP family intramembrane glutamic endopeptidase [Flavobacterium sp. j3]|uniref:CPBP family intramembrane glutamic endopeptidase n=1 Tax=Flavobacterium aureirubrum TaxID=3133147 RepID=A0ABU9N3B2_9FLAO